MAGWNTRCATDDKGTVMSDRPIQAGDLVIIVKPTSCCNNSFGIGFIYKVEKVCRVDFYCNKCHAPQTAIGAIMSNGSGDPIRNLKRIPPLAELESTEHREETPA